MATIVMEKLRRVFISLQQIWQVPRMLTEAAPSMPATVRDIEVPYNLRERYICAGYRPLNQNWLYYFLSLFQCHNETINVWTHLLAFLVFLVKLSQLTETVDFANDHHSWPLLILVLSSLIYSACSAVAHLLGGKSELCHYCFFFLDYIGVGQYQHSSAVVNFYYAADESFHSYMCGIFLPVATLLSCLSCLVCCHNKFRCHNPPPQVRIVCQMLPLAFAYFWDSSPVIKRLLSWSTNDPAIMYHFGHVAFFFSCAFFFTFPLPQCCFPGRCNFLGHNHQMFHVLLSCGTFCQIHAYELDYVVRRELYSHLQKSAETVLFVRLYIATLIGCSLIAAFMLRNVKQALDLKTKSK